MDYDKAISIIEKAGHVFKKVLVFKAGTVTIEQSEHLRIFLDTKIDSGYIYLDGTMFVPERWYEDKSMNNPIQILKSLVDLINKG